MPTKLLTKLGTKKTCSIFEYTQKSDEISSSHNKLIYIPILVLFGNCLTVLIG